MKFCVKTFVNRNIFASNLYVINSESGNILIDPSFFDDEIKKYLDKIGGLDAVLITHGHGDHIRCADVYMQKYHNADLYVHKLDAELLKDTRLNCSLRVGDDEIIIKTTPKIIEEGDLKIGGYDIKVFHFQGHTNGSVMYYFPQQKIMFLGDTVMVNSVGTPDIPTGDIVLLMQSIQKFKNLGLSDEVLCYPGHGDNISFGEIMKMNPYLR